MQIKDKTIQRLHEVMLIKKLSCERVASYLGCSGVQVWRWTRKGGVPTDLYRRVIEDGIKRINLEVPDTEVFSDGEGFEGEEFPIFFDALCKKVDTVTRETFLFNDAYLHGFQEILFLALKNGVKLPTLEKRI